MKIRYTPPTTTGSPTAYYLTNAKITKFATENQFESNDFNRSGRKHQFEGTAVLVGTTATTLSDIAWNLNKPRGLLEIDFTDTGSTYTKIVEGGDGGNGVEDARNGPIPSIQITEIIGGTTSAAVVSFSFTYFGCGDTRIQRFEMNVSQSIDQAGMVKMVKNGTLVVSGKYINKNTPVKFATTTTVPTVPTNDDVKDYGASPDLYRNLIVGKPLPRFVRVSQNFSMDSSLRTLTFSVEDQMVYRELSYPVMVGTASFSYERSLGSDNGLMGTKTFNCSYQGEMDTPPQDLLKVAIEASSARIDWANDFIQSVSVKEPNIYEKNVVELQVIALGSGADKIDPKVISMMFTDPHPTGASVKFSSAYPSNGDYLTTIDGLKWDPCLVPDVVQDIVDSNTDDESTKGERTITVTDSGAPIEKPDNTDPVTTPINPDTGIPDNNSIKHYEAAMDYETEDSGCDFLETVGGESEYPFQFHLPKVYITQTVKMISTTQNCPIPWEDTGEPSLLWKQKISVKSASVDASGKPIYAIVATRSARVQTSRSENSYLQSTSGSSVASFVSTATGQGMQRRVYAPASIRSPRSPYTQDLSYTTTTDDITHGDPRRTDYIR